MEPPITQSDAVASLLSLSIAAAAEPQLPLSQPFSSHTFTDSSPASPPHPSTLSSGVKQHRRLASTGKTKRRLSDAREAAVRPSPAALQASSAALSLASLSLSASPASMPSAVQLSTSLTGASKVLIPDRPTSIANGLGAPDDSGLLTDGVKTSQSTAIAPSTEKGDVTPIPISNGKNGKKRGMDHKCESCSKIYRHPSCLIKHRWEHTPHWREASKFVLSKHQQVQLLEAAAILSHISPSVSGISLPEDRSLWPSFLSGGSLPPPDAPVAINADSQEQDGMVASSPYPSQPVSSSVPASSILGNFTRANSAGPRLHDYSIPTSAGPGGVTQLRPGLLGMPTGPGVAVTSTAPMPVPVPNSNSTGNIDPFVAYRDTSANSWNSSPYGNGHPVSTSHHSTGVSLNSIPFANSDERSTRAGTGGWSLPRSSVRSVSASSQSRSRSGSASGSRSDDDSIDVDVEGLDDFHHNGYHGRHGFSARNKRWKHEDDEFSIGFSVREEDEEDGVIAPGSKEKNPQWDDMELEMDMD